MTRDYLNDIEYDAYRRYIDEQINFGRTFQQFNADVDENWTETYQFLKLLVRFQGYPSLGETAEEVREAWLGIINAKREYYENYERFSEPTVLSRKGEKEASLALPRDKRSAWQLYREHLLASNWSKSSVDPIEKSALKILRELRKATPAGKPVKGMVVGHVQSGKTANMAGLLAMAADNGWNLFIVLTGTIDNLRQQTHDRLFSDLHHAGNLVWSSITNPSAETVRPDRAEDLFLNPAHPNRYLMVCLKNSTRLRNLLAWFNRNPVALSKMKILIIDDEADQASVSTAKDAERTAINKAIIALSQVKAQAVNYVGFTATPAANFLNEGPGEGLYPEDFIVSLPQSNMHFGPPQIFGVESQSLEPLGIDRIIDEDEDIPLIAEIHNNGEEAAIPKSLRDAVQWFICSVAAIRFWGYKKPVSMLIHTSQLVKHHEEVEKAVIRILADSRHDTTSFISNCKSLWSRETQEFSLETFKEIWPAYELTDSIPDYPKFEELLPFIELLLSIKATPIKMDFSGELTYHRGIHICVDNCKKNSSRAEDEVLRLFYPTSNHNLDFASAFIVIGGSTLSRGLTIENLVSTYFLRATALGDTLMQMGRWFGYRRGYELLPRLWMPQKTFEKFQFLAEAEEFLRNDLRRFMDEGVDPSQYGPRVRTHPIASFIRPTAKNKMQDAVPNQYDFSGINKQTTLFHDGVGSESIHKQNLDSTKKALATWSAPRRASAGHLIWDSVGFASLKSLLGGITFHEDAEFFSDLSPFFNWYEDNHENAGYENWNVVLINNPSDKANKDRVCSSDIGLSVRSRRERGCKPGSRLSIGALRSPIHLLADCTDDISKAITNPRNDVIEETRRKTGLGQVPQLLIYLIDKDSQPNEQKGEIKPENLRGPLNVKEHLVGFSIWIPSVMTSSKGANGGRTSVVSSVTVRIPSVLSNNDDDILGTGEE